MYSVLKSIKYPVFALFLPSWGGFWDVYTLFFYRIDTKIGRTKRSAYSVV